MAEGVCKGGIGGARERKREESEAVLLAEAAECGSRWERMTSRRCLGVSVCSGCSGNIRVNSASVLVISRQSTSALRSVYAGGRPSPLFSYLFVYFHFFCFVASSTVEKCKKWGSAPAHFTLLFIGHLLCRLQGRRMLDSKFIKI